MNQLQESMLQFGSLMTVGPKSKSETLDDWELVQFLKPRPQLLEGFQDEEERFRVVLNMMLFDPSEVEIEVVKGETLEVRAKHGPKENTDGVRMSREIKYTFEISEKAKRKELLADWSKDGYLLIREKTGQEVVAREVKDKIKLLPEKKETKMRPSVELGSVRNLIEDIQGKAQDILRYMRQYSNVGEEEAEEATTETTEKLGGASGAERGKDQEIIASPEKGSPVKLDAARDDASDEHHR